MAQDAMALFNGGHCDTTWRNSVQALVASTTSSVFGYEKAFPYSDSFVTAPHFWDVRTAGANRPCAVVDVVQPLPSSGPSSAVGRIRTHITGPGALETWRWRVPEAASIGIRAASDTSRTLIGDLEFRRIVHEDAHPPFDDDPFEEWMSGNGHGELFTALFDGWGTVDLVRWGRSPFRTT